MMLTLTRRAVFAPSKTMMMAALSTQTEAAVAAALTKARWADCRDEVKEIAKLMREGTTNHSVALPSINLQHQVNDHLRGLHSLVERKQHQLAFNQVRSLKAMVKDELYYQRQRPQHQMMSFSTAAQQVEDFEDSLKEMHWDDVKDEVQEIDRLMNEGSTNKAVRTPDSELQRLFENSINDIKLMLEKNPTQHQVVFDQIHALKTFVKDRLYNDLTTTEHVRAFENEMDALRWSDIKNEVSEISKMMREGTTNHAVPLPSDDLSKAVAEGLNEVDALIHEHSPTADVHARAFKRIHELKSMIKAELYK
jgi:hypothetical protein